MTQQARLTERAARWYALLLRLYPADHRATFGPQMLQTFKDEYRDLAAARGGVGVAFWLAVIGDGVKGIVKEHAVMWSARRILVTLILLGVIEGAGIALIGPRLKHIPAPLVALLAIIPLLAVLSALLLLVILLKAGGRQRAIAAVIVAAFGALGIFGVQDAVRGANTNTWCATTHATTSQPPATLTTATDYFLQGDYDYDRGDCDRAIADYTEAIARDPAYAEAYNNRAYTAMARQEYAQALPDLDRAIQLRPDYAHALMNRGDIYNYYYQRAFPNSFSGSVIAVRSLRSGFSRPSDADRAPPLALPNPVSGR